MDTKINLVNVLEDEETAVQKRLKIGRYLAKFNDPRRGVYVKNGIPDIVWLPVAPGGELTLQRHWQPETADEIERFKQIGPFVIEPFFISKYLVTTAQFDAFLKADDGYDNLAWWQDMPMKFQRQPIEKQQHPIPNYPRDTVSWYQCIAFTRWMSHRLKRVSLPLPNRKGVLIVGENAQIRLPTEWEWQWAAQNGEEKRLYPWGEAQPNAANTAETGLQQATAVGMFPQGAAACGAMDMAGNVMEWCLNDKANPTIIDVASTETKVLRGGDWGYNLANATTTYTDDDKPHALDALNGLRLVLGPIIQNV